MVVAPDVLDAESEALAVVASAAGELDYASIDNEDVDFDQFLDQVTMDGNKQECYGHSDVEEDCHDAEEDCHGLIIQSSLSDELDSNAQLSRVGEGVYEVRGGEEVAEGGEEDGVKSSAKIMIVKRVYYPGEMVTGIVKVSLQNLVTRHYFFK